ncbi:MAG TPA: hypothetical protein VEZ48_01060 [Sphingomonadaceae bacterium]|jgi:GAF domain-containing protein|nr:hypothetical protein [Sphingomonadaceae bacterium]
MSEKIIQSSLGERDRVFLSRLGERLRQEHDPQTILGYANRALGEHLGALRVGYGEIDEHEEWLTLRSDWTASVESNAGRFPLSSFGAGIVAENRAGRTLSRASLTQMPGSDPNI